MSHMRRASAAPTRFSSVDLLAGVAEDGLAAAAARAAEAQVLGFEQRHAQAAFGAGAARRKARRCRRRRRTRRSACSPASGACGAGGGVLA